MGWEEPMEPRYSNVTVELVGRDGNAFAIIGRVRRALREAGVPEEEIRRFVEEAMAGDYDDMLRTVMRYVEG
jgi:hypothetical protein